MANKLSKKNTSVQKIVTIKVQPKLGANKPFKTPAQGVAIPRGEYVSAVGRRKTATARVRLYKEPGDFVVNEKVVGDYFANIKQAPSLYNMPMIAAGVQGKHAVSVKVGGSGLNSQLGAVVHGIARALLKIDPTYRTLLKEKGLLTRDDRMKETRKIGKGGKARRTKQSPKR